jgi:hypothetical protein
MAEIGLVMWCKEEDRVVKQVMAGFGGLAGGSRDDQSPLDQDVRCRQALQTRGSSGSGGGASGCYDGRLEEGVGGTPRSQCYNISSNMVEKSRVGPGRGTMDRTG